MLDPFFHPELIHHSVFIAPGAVITGQVTLGPETSVWFGCVLRGDVNTITIGAQTNIQDGSILHVDGNKPLRLGNRISLGHGAIAHGCTVEDDVLIGIRATVLSGAVIGPGSLVGASALVKENDVIPPGSLVLGAPAKVVGEVRDAHRAAIRAGADSYLLKEMEPEDLLAKLKEAAAGQVTLTERLTRLLAHSLREDNRPRDPDQAGLTDQESRILDLIAQGKSNKLIARELEIAESTVKVHVKHLLRKLNLRSRVEAAIWAVEKRHG